MYKAKVAENIFEFEFSDEKALEGTVNAEAFKMDAAQQADVYHVLHNCGSYKVKMVRFDKDNKTCVIKVNNNQYVVDIEDRYDLLLDRLGIDNVNNHKVNDLKSPMPGLVLRIMVKSGDSVKKGDGLMVLEAMKMENIIKASTDGIIKYVDVKKSDTVEKNQVLIKFE